MLTRAGHGSQLGRTLVIVNKFHPSPAPGANLYAKLARKGCNHGTPWPVSLAAAAALDRAPRLSRVIFRNFVSFVARRFPSPKGPVLIFVATRAILFTAEYTQQGNAYEYSRLRDMNAHLR